MVSSTYTMLFKDYNLKYLKFNLKSLKELGIFKKINDINE